MDARIHAIEQAQLKADRPPFKVGDTLRVFVRITEEEKTRIQPFEGIVISRKGSLSRETFTLRRISYGEGVERSFFLHSPFIEKILVVKHGHVRRAKLYYLRKKVGKGARISSTNLGSSTTLVTEIGESANPGGAQGGGEEHVGQAPKAPTTPSVRSEASSAAST